MADLPCLQHIPLSKVLFRMFEGLKTISVVIRVQRVDSIPGFSLMQKIVSYYGILIISGDSRW